MDKKFKRLFFIAAIVIFIFMLSFKITLSTTEKSPAQQEVFHFLEGKEKSRELPEIYTAQEIAHLEDVKSIMEKVNLFFYLLIIALTISFLHLRKNKEELFNAPRLIGKITLIITALLLLLTLFFFEQTFVGFHLLFFPQGNWMFPTDSFLIQTFPLEFFIDFTKSMLLNVLLLGSLFILLPLFWKYAKRGYQKKINK